MISGARAPLRLPSHLGQSLVPTGTPTNETDLRVTLRHPGYPDGSNLLLMFEALDPVTRTDQVFTEADPLQFGLHHDTARVACAIIANCRWDGYLSESRADGAPPAATDPDHILRGRNYYFHVPRHGGDNDSARDAPYPIVPSFAHFRFPHGNLPPTWTASSLRFPENVDQLLGWSFEHEVFSRDVSCRLTASTLGTEITHVLPHIEHDWFADNQMVQYMSRPEAIPANITDDTKNTMLLCSHLRTVFDQRGFVIVPKWGEWLVHVLSGAPSQELAAVYHNIKPQPLTGLALECVFARFAWTVLINAHSCVRSGVPRRVVCTKDGVSKLREVSGSGNRTRFPPLPMFDGHSQSPRKRKRAASESASTSQVSSPDH